MLPFLKTKKQDGGSVISTIYRAPDDASKNKSDALDAIAEDLLKAIHGHDKPMLLEAIRSMFEIMDSEPHVEGPHLESNDQLE